MSTKTESKYGFDQYPLIAQHPNKPHISLRRHPNGPVYWDSDEDCLGSPGSYVQALVDGGQRDVFYDVHWIAMALGKEAPHPDLAGVEVVTPTTMEQVRMLLLRAHACVSPPNQEDRDYSGASQDITEALGLLGRGPQ